LGSRTLDALRGTAFAIQAALGRGFESRSNGGEQGLTIEGLSEHGHGAIFVASDTWRLNDHQQLTFSGFFRTYSLTPRSNSSPVFDQQSPFPVVGGLR
jgi:hypothetical protein